MSSDLVTVPNTVIIYNWPTSLNSVPGSNRHKDLWSLKSPEFTNEKLRAREVIVVISRAKT